MELPSAAAAALAAAENQAAHAGPQPTGRLISGDMTVLDVDALLPGEQAHELKVRVRRRRAITRHARARAHTHSVRGSGRRCSPPARRRRR
jgi:hypothetical protein